MSTDDLPQLHPSVDSTPADDEAMRRADSFSSPSFSLKGNAGTGSFPSVVETSPVGAPSPTTGNTAHLPFGDEVAPKSGKFVDLILHILRPNGDHAVTEEIVKELCTDVREVFRAESSLLEINVAEDEQLCVVGDIHGQLCDLRANVFRLEPNPKRKLLFMGDYVDRGPHGVEVICLLFALKVEFPDRVFLLRGNHEEAMTSRIYGFLYEVRTKFDGSTDSWVVFNATFCFLPLAAVVTSAGHRFLCVHGGLSPGFDDLATLQAIERSDYGGTLDTTSASIVDGLLWSDPSDNTSTFTMNERGCGFAFGAAATTDFCEANKLEFICRAHQIAMEGYYWSHGGRVLTVFSAPNYCGVNNNLAAILMVDGKWNLKFIQYDSSSASNEESGSPSASPPAYFS